MSRHAKTVLLVEDEEYVRESLATWLLRRGYAVRTAGSVEEVRADLSYEGADLVVTDLRLPGANGAALLKHLKRVAPRLPVLVLTGHGTVDSAVACMKDGAIDYLTKPVDPDELVLAVERALREQRLKREVAYLRDGGGCTPPLGVSRAWKEVLELLDVAAPTDTTVLLLGESGVGKEVAARWLHDKSPRSGAAFVSVNCAAVPAELFESEFFGHRRGAFTGAGQDREGRFQVADGGTLFLDEVNSLPLASQAKILRAIQDGTFERVGESRPSSADVRLVCASNADLGEEVAAGRFRADLYYRINVMPVRIPPLRERPEDILPLAESFLEEIGQRLNRRLHGLTPAARDRLLGYRWPGNVRELRNVIERGVLLERGDTLNEASLPPLEGRSDAATPDAEAPLHLRAILRATERRLLEEALERAGGVRREAARLLGIDERNLPYFLRKHGL